MELRRRLSRPPGLCDQSRSSERVKRNKADAVKRVQRCEKMRFGRKREGLRVPEDGGESEKVRVRCGRVRVDQVRHVED